MADILGSFAARGVLRVLNGLLPISGHEVGSELGRSVLTDVVAETIRLLPVLLPGGAITLYSGVPSGLDGHAEATGAASMVGMCAGSITRAAAKIIRGSSMEDYKETLFKPDLEHAHDCVFRPLYYVIIRI